MHVFRIVREKYLDSALSGRGAQLSNGFRWNSFGTSMVYTAQSRSLALLEIVVHLDLSVELPTDRFMVDIDIPDDIDREVVQLEDLPQGWNAKPPQRISQFIGDNFISNNSAAILEVPSSIIPKESNFLINPYHPDFSRIALAHATPFILDSRFGYF